MPKSNYYDRLTTQGILVNDPTKEIDVVSNGTGGDGFWSQKQPGSTGPYIGPLQDPFVNKVEALEKQVEAQALTIKIMRLKLLAIEGKFTQEEVANIRKMLMSEDEASRTLADSIIENA